MDKMNEKNKLRLAIATELCVCITMLILFLSETEKLYQFFNLLLAMLSMGFMFENHLKLVELESNE